MGDDTWLVRNIMSYICFDFLVKKNEAMSAYMSVGGRNGITASSTLEGMLRTRRTRTTANFFTGMTTIYPTAEPHP